MIKESATKRERINLQTEYKYNLGKGVQQNFVQTTSQKRKLDKNNNKSLKRSNKWATLSEKRKGFDRRKYNMQIPTKNFIRHCHC